MGADAGELRHRMAHQPADAAIAVRKWMDVVEAMMRGGHRHDAPGRSQRLERVALFETAHEVVDPVAGGWKVTANGQVMLGTGAPGAWLQGELSGRCAGAAIGRARRDRIQDAAIG